ncbi:MAG: LysM peptidoglycan-binding domain-containing protein [Betaproteobacteria bacterium]|nr:LysM peptidoglycan-binding domain-containing protein [Betaproteobacteria bacterium]MDE2048602.1 LysM peptidoglycan-binding domain-containing protein [Betaproteobacteria bacterium]
MRFKPVQTSALTIVAALAAGGLAGAAHAQSRYPITPQQRATAEQVASTGIALSELAPNAPDTHKVVPGDTLWGISKMFLRSPWRWPELWGMNLQQIRNPHLIYPGQVLVLDKSNGRARLRVADSGDGSGLPTVKLEPHARYEKLSPLGIPTIPQRLIEPFLSEPLVIEPNALESAARIVATQEGRVLLGPGDLAFARGEQLGTAKSFQAFRPARPLKDPETGEVLAYESTYLGTLDLIRPGRALAADEQKGSDSGFSLVGMAKAATEEAATLRVVNFKQEIGVGDRLLPAPPKEVFSYAPHAPDKPVSGQVMSIYEGVALAGQNSVVTLNRGKRDGLERGDVVTVWRAGKVVRDRSSEDDRDVIKLPDQRSGYMMVFRVFDRVAYALVLNVENTVQVGDKFTNPQ